MTKLYYWLEETAAFLRENKKLPDFPQGWPHINKRYTKFNDMDINIITSGDLNKVKRFCKTHKSFQLEYNELRQHFYLARKGRIICRWSKHLEEFRGEPSGTWVAN